MANSLDPDERAHYDLSHLDLHALFAIVYVLIQRVERVNA